VKNRWYPAANRDAKVEWDFEDRLVKVTKSDGTVVENVYDVDGVLVGMSVNGVGVEYLVDTSGGLSHVVAEVDSAGAVSVLYVRAGDMLLEEIRGGVAKMYEADGLRSVRGMLDASGARTDTWSYEAFGTTLSSTGTSANPYRFAGERFVGDVGMYQNRARWLDTRTGRFASVDPAEGQDRTPVTFRPFLYGAASPVSMADPTGLFFGGVSQVVLAVAIVATYAALALDRLTIVGGRSINSVQFDVIGSAYDRAHILDSIQQITRTRGGANITPSYCNSGVSRVRINLIATNLTDETQWSAGEVCSQEIRLNIAMTARAWIPTTQGRQRPTISGMLAHEFGHSALCKGYTPNAELDVIRTVENPIMTELGQPYERTRHALCDQDDTRSDCRAQ
jgi:RHS repeat-associated protein